MRKLFFLLLIVGFIITTGCKKNHFDHPCKANLKENLQKILDKHLVDYKSKFAGKPVGFGLYVKEEGNGGKFQSGGQNVYVSSGFPQEYGDNIQFRGASTTKTFTAAAILKLRQQNKINLDDFITDKIPGTNEPYVPATAEYAIPNKDKITIRLLLQHRAGVFDITNDSIPATANAPYAGKKYVDYTMAQQGENHTFTFPEMINVVAVNHLSYFEPGAAFHYSNTGYNILATIIERVSGKPYHQFLQDEFLTPLQMYHTRFPYLGTDEAMPIPYVTGWLKQGNDFTEMDEQNVSYNISEGNIITTPADLAKWANALYATNTILNADLHAQMIEGIPTNEEHVIYGLGTELNPPGIGYGHNGAHPAYMTVMRYHPETNASYVLFCNFLDASSLKDVNDQGERLSKMVREAIQAVAASK